MKSLFVLLLIFLLVSFPADTKVFIGKIVYKNTFTDLQGNDLTNQLGSIFGREQRYFINRENYKGIDEAGNWVQLYQRKLNIYYYFSKDKTATKFDGSMQSAEKVVVTKSAKTERIAGYKCNILQVDKGESVTVYYYSPLIKTNKEIFAKHSFGDWNKYLEATDGALPLKYILSSKRNQYIQTATATEVVTMKLTDKDFEFPLSYQLKN